MVPSVGSGRSVPAADRPGMRTAAWGPGEVDRNPRVPCAGHDGGGDHPFGSPTTGFRLHSVDAAGRLHRVAGLAGIAAGRCAGPGGNQFHEGVIPESVNSDLFLPNALRSQLGLDDNARRYARDALSLSMLLASRERTDLDRRAPRRGRESRVAQSAVVRGRPADRCPASTEVLWRVRGPRPALAGGLVWPGDRPHFPIPRPAPLAEPIERLSPTAFRDYLACPYRFYLKHVLRVEGCVRRRQGNGRRGIWQPAARSPPTFRRRAACQSIDVVEITQRLDNCWTNACWRRSDGIRWSRSVCRSEQLRTR